ncbi:hypothetical protein HOG17_04610 [Candidatus Peregrinibacteria bacterium]|nr:hypothetical protein [Candidatus Peregrinibacteria bacterium]MBT4147848.1 hypothetical protein [Candidatus Peregrinibacteria bacterium]MBT4366189.1 hypothetical protein [Candidatus Peregrinibacteria bacterium]MBT4455594.1 hypothetical protein [Candidatus Peregrinibacteria bacterium]
MKSNTKWKFLSYMLASLLGGVVLGWVGLILFGSGIVCSNIAVDVCVNNMLWIGVGVGTVLGALIFALFNVKNYKKALKKLEWMVLALVILMLLIILMITMFYPTESLSLFERFVDVGVFIMVVSGVIILHSVIPAILLGLAFYKWKK